VRALPQPIDDCKAQAQNRHSECGEGDRVKAVQPDEEPSQKKRSPIAIGPNTQPRSAAILAPGLLRIQDMSDAALLEVSPFYPSRIRTCNLWHPRRDSPHGGEGRKCSVRTWADRDRESASLRTFRTTGFAPAGAESGLFLNLTPADCGGLFAVQAPTSSPTSPIFGWHPFTLSSRHLRNPLAGGLRPGARRADMRK